MLSSTRWTGATLGHRHPYETDVDLTGPLEDWNAHLFPARDKAAPASAANGASAADSARWTDDQVWSWPTVVAMPAIATVLALWWLLAQPRRTHPGDLSVGAPAPGGVELREGALSDAVARRHRAPAGGPASTRTHERLVPPP
ncbi:hypothetical protein [Streptomyces yangpuensis]|uniref:hypothetical protein n=1 Tax=Streptomyces yangpuensis TaxID=1648182 RepID=UPI00371FC1EA